MHAFYKSEKDNSKNMLVMIAKNGEASKVASMNLSESDEHEILKSAGGPIAGFDLHHY